MKGSAAAMLALGVFAMTIEPSSVTAQGPDPPAHVSNSFQFLIRAPLNRATALFGPEGERCWAGEHWKPEFLYPRPAKDVEGAVFTVQHGPYKAVWLNTVFDVSGGRVQYVSMVGDKLVFTVEVRLSSVSSTETRVEVTYVRTALDTGMNKEVEAQGRSDRGNGPHWQQAIESCLGKREGQ